MRLRYRHFRFIYFVLMSVCLLFAIGQAYYCQKKISAETQALFCNCETLILKKDKTYVDE